MTVLLRTLEPCYPQPLDCFYCLLQTIKIDFATIMSVKVTIMMRFSERLSASLLHKNPAKHEKKKTNTFLCQFVFYITSALLAVIFKFSAVHLP